MTTPFSVLSGHLNLFKQLYPQFSAMFANWQEDLEDTQVLKGNPAQRVFRAIREGYQLQAEICRRADVEASLLDEMLEAGVLSTIEQGGKTDGARGARKKIFQIVETPAMRQKPINIRQLAHA